MDVDFVYPGNSVERLGIWCRLDVDDLEEPVKCIENNQRAHKCEEGFDPISFRREMILPKENEEGVVDKEGNEDYGAGLS